MTYCDVVYLRFAHCRLLLLIQRCRHSYRAFRLSVSGSKHLLYSTLKTVHKYHADLAMLLSEDSVCLHVYQTFTASPFQTYPFKFMNVINLSIGLAY